jgi:hypothetical protein
MVPHEADFSHIEMRGVGPVGRALLLTHYDDDPVPGLVKS